MAEPFEIGTMCERVEVLTLQTGPDGCSWERTGTRWASVTYPRGSNLFSRVGIGVRSVRIQIRRMAGLSLHNALRIGGQHLFLTKIDLDETRLHQIIEAAAIAPTPCRASRKIVETDARHNRPKLVQDAAYSFPACVTEKYIRLEELTPQDVTEAVHVLVTPKAVELRVGEVVTVGEADWCVQIGHTLDSYKNEYEVRRKEDA